MSQEFQGRFIQEGLSIDHTPDADVDGGQVVIQNNIVAIAKRDIDFDLAETGALRMSGVFDVVKKEEAFATIGANIYWDETGDPYEGTGGTGAATATPTAHTFMGFVLETAESTDETVRIVLRSTITVVGEGFALSDLSDIDAVNYTAGLLLVGTGSKFADVALSGPFALAASGLMSMASATVVADGSVQGDAAAVAEGFTMVSAAEGAKGVILPTAVAGAMCIVKNNENAVLKLWPNSSDAIDALGADNAMSMPAYSVRLLVAYDVTTWYSTEVPDGGLGRAKLAQEDLAVYRIPLQECRSGGGLVFTATELADSFKITNGGFGVGTLILAGEASISETETSTLCFEFTLPPEYVDGETIKVAAEVEVDSSGSGNAVTETIQFEAWLLDDEGAVGSDLAGGGAQTMAGGGDAFATYESTITPAGLVAGDKLLIFIQTVIIEDNGTSVFAAIGNIEVQLDIKG